MVSLNTDTKIDLFTGFNSLISCIDQSLEALIEKCQALLNSTHSVNVKWEKRMANLNENWEASRPLIFKTILLLGGSDSVSPPCGLCYQKPWLIRCVECDGKTVCPECDAL